MMNKTLSRIIAAGTLAAVLTASVPAAAAEADADADKCKDELSVVRKRHIDRIQESRDNNNLQVSLVYLNILQESQQLLSNMRHQLRAAKKFMDN